MALNASNGWNDRNLIYVALEFQCLDEIRFTTCWMSFSLESTESITSYHLDTRLSILHVRSNILMNQILFTSFLNLEITKKKEF